MTREKRSLLLGLITIVLWGSLATFGNLLIHLPPFFTLGVSFLIGSLLSLRNPREMFPSMKLLLFGTAGYFGYHFFLFYAFRFAPAVEANLINYLWPVLMVMMAPLFERNTQLRRYHFTGAILSIIGCLFLVSGAPADSISGEESKGYALALMAAITWPVYSLGRKKFPSTSVCSIGGFCLSTGVLCLITHALIEPKVSLTFSESWKLICMGLGPFGLAFYFWDTATREGDARVLGALAYLTPVISTLGLVFFAGKNFTWSSFLAMFLITGGACLGLLDFRVRKQ
ncbi:MAG: DMT family transporter [Bacteriovoracaceae bacterium]